MTISAIARGPVAHDVLVWITGKNRTTGADETMGLWTGPEDRSFTVGGVARTYRGVGQIIEVPPIKSRAGLTVQMHTLRLSATSPEVEAAMRLYDPRLGPVEIHVARFEPTTGALLGIDRAYRGRIDKAPINTPAKGKQGGGVALSVASAARSLTRPLTLKKSDASQRRRSDDRFFRHADVAGRVERWWGTDRVGGEKTGPFGGPRPEGVEGWQ